MLFLLSKPSFNSLRVVSLLFRVSLCTLSRHTCSWWALTARNDNAPAGVNGRDTGQVSVLDDPRPGSRQVGSMRMAVGWFNGGLQCCYPLPFARLHFAVWWFRGEMSARVSYFKVNPQHRGKESCIRIKFNRTNVLWPSVWKLIPRIKYEISRTTPIFPPIWWPKFQSSISLISRSLPLSGVLMSTSRWSLISFSKMPTITRSPALSTSW